jgi:hypothetical protein
MSKRRMASPRIVMPHGAGLWFFIVLVVLGAIAGAFFGGVFLAREETKSFEGTVNGLHEEKNELSVQLAQLKQEQIVLERTLEIDREASRTAQENLKREQDERLELEKEVSFLKRLIREGGGGVLKVQDFVLRPTDEERVFAYSVTVSQMIQEFGESAGRVVIKLEGKRGDKDVTLGLDKLPGSRPTTQNIRFNHFQNLGGTLKIPEDLEPQILVIEIKPTTKKLIPIIETFPWNPEGEGGDNGGDE